MDQPLNNPMGLDGFAFVEFTAPQAGQLEPVFETLGFTRVARHRSKDAHLWRQGEIDLIINYEPHCAAAFHASEHGPSACGMAFRVRDAQLAYARALRLGAEPLEMAVAPMELRIPAIRGIGGAPLYLIDRYGEGSSIYDIDFVFIDDVDPRPKGAGLGLIDHLTHNVYRGRMDHWAGFYERLFNFREIRFFDIRGEHTGLRSRAMSAPDNLIRIPLNEEAETGGQIEEYLIEHRGEGIQHIAFSCEDLVSTIDRLRELGVSMMKPPPETYYEMLSERLPGHGEDAAALRARGILLDGSTEGGEVRLLLQIFSQPLVGPLFFEFIQRKRDEGFGEGNFQALFESLERDQVRRKTLEGVA